MIRAVLAAALLLNLTYCGPPEVERWRSDVAAVFATVDTNQALCVIEHESDGDPEATFDEWVHWWSQHPDTARTVDYPRPPRDTALGRGGDTRWSVGLFQISVGNLALTRISALDGWVPPNNPHGYSAGHRYSIIEAHAVLLDPVNNISAAFAIMFGAGWLPAWAADRSVCALR